MTRLFNRVEGSELTEGSVTTVVWHGVHHPSEYQNLLKHLEGLSRVQIITDIHEVNVFSESRAVFCVVDSTGFPGEICCVIAELLCNGLKCLLVLHEDMSRDLLSNVNYLLEQFGICGNPDKVIDSIYTNELVPEYATALFDSFTPFVYPSGCTLTVQGPSQILAVSSEKSYPMSQPVCALSTNSNGGGLLVIGSTEIFSDRFFGVCESSTRFVKTDLLPFLSNDHYTCPNVISSPHNIAPYRLIPDLVYMVDMFDELEEPDTDYEDLPTRFAPRWPTIDHDLMIDVAETFEVLNVPFGPVTFDTASLHPHFLIPQLGYCPNISHCVEYDEKTPLPMNLSPIPRFAQTDDEIEYVLNACDPKTKLLDLARLLIVSYCN